MHATLIPLWELLSMAAFEILLIGFVLFPSQLLNTWFSWLRIVPIVGTPSGFRAVAAIGLIPFTLILVVSTRAWLYLGTG